MHPLQNRVCTFFLSVVNNASIFKIDNPVRNSALQLQDESLLANSVQEIWLPRMLSICHTKQIDRLCKAPHYESRNVVERVH